MNNETEQEITALYRTREFGLRDIAEMFDVGVHQIRNVLARHGVQMNKSHARLPKKRAMRNEICAHHERGPVL